MTDEQFHVLVDRRLKAIEDRLDEREGKTVPAYLSIEHASQLTDLSPDTIRRAVLRGELIASNKGSGKRPLYRIPRDELDRWMRSMSASAIPSQSALSAKVKRYFPALVS